MTAGAAAIGGALAAGVGIGLLYFAGLWWTVNRLAFRRHAGLWVLASFAVRASIALFGFYLASGGDWRRLLACLAGFVAVRVLLVRRIEPSAK